MRCAEFTCRNEFNPSDNLCIGDVEFVSDTCVHIVLKTSKTDVFREGVTIKLFKLDGDICPYKLLKKLTNVRLKVAELTDPLLIQDNGVCLTRNFFNNKLIRI